MLLEVYAGVVTAAAMTAAVRLWRTRRWRPWPGGGFHAPTPDSNRYLVVMHLAGSTIEQYHGYDGVKARHAYEQAPMEAGCVCEFYEWGERRGRKAT